MSLMRDSFGPDDGAGLLNILAVQPVQQLAVADPAVPLKLLAKQARLSQNRLARIVNDFLADPRVH